MHLPESKRDEVSGLIRQYLCLFNDVPTCTNWIEHDVRDVRDAQPIKLRLYRMSPEMLKHLDSEVAYMLENKIALPSFSSWSPKPDNSPRVCTDFRKVNLLR